MYNLKIRDGTNKLKVLACFIVMEIGIKALNSTVQLGAQKKKKKKNIWCEFPTQCYIIQVSLQKNWEKP